MGLDSVFLNLTIFAENRMRGGPNIYPGSVSQCALDRDEEKSSGLFDSPQGRRTPFSATLSKHSQNVFFFLRFAIETATGSFFIFQEKKEIQRGNTIVSRDRFIYRTPIFFSLLLSDKNHCGFYSIPFHVLPNPKKNRIFAE